MDVVWNKHYNLYVIVISIIPQDYEIYLHILFVGHIYYFRYNSTFCVQKERFFGIEFSLFIVTRKMEDCVWIKFWKMVI